MKALLYIVLLIVIGFIAQLFLPFWIIALVGFALALFFPVARGLGTFFAGLLGGMLLWGGMAWYQQLPNDGVLAERVSTLMGFGSSWLLLLITALLGGLLAAFGSLSGYLLKGVFQRSS